MTTPFLIPPVWALEFAERIQQTSIGQWVAQSGLAYPGLEVVHVLGIMLLFGSILFVDIRLLGFGKSGPPLQSLLKFGVPLAFVGFAVVLCSGALMLSSNAAGFIKNGPFQIKMLLLLLVGLNMLWFELGILRNRAIWVGDTVPKIARISAAFSLIIWLIIIGAGRWIGFTMSPF